jgi:putative oxidoreductase
MPAFITFGRVLFAVLFIYSGATKLFDVQATTNAIASKVVIPALLTPYTEQLEAAVGGMKTPQMLALAVGIFEVVAGLMIAVNFGARFFSILLIFFVLMTTYYFHDFWNQPAPDAKMLIDALKNLSIIGALFMIAGYGRGPRSSEPAYDV